MAKDNKPANRTDSGKFKKGQSGNPAGRPKDGESWASVIKEISEMTPDQVLKLVGKDNDLGKALAKLPQKVMMKKLVVARILAALMFEPSGGLWNTLMERAEGKVPQKIEADVNHGWKGFITSEEDPDAQTDSE